jgi:hypothetical protein
MVGPPSRMLMRDGFLFYKDNFSHNLGELI